MRFLPPASRISRALAVSSSFYLPLLSFLSLIFAISAAVGAPGQGAASAGPEEAKAIPYTLPDPLVGKDGKPVTRATWPRRRREILSLFTEHVYGRLPPNPPHVRATLRDVDAEALGGQAIRKQITLTLTGRGQTRELGLLVYLPKASRGPVPAFLGLNFEGNASVDADPGIALLPRWTNQGTHVTPAASTRGAQAGRWNVATVIGRGYAVATLDCADLFPDHVKGRVASVLPLFGPQAEDAPDAAGAIAVWAWGLSRALDVLASDRAIDARRVAVIGHSRLGKTSLWAGAQDPRFAMVISNDSGEGGAALARRLVGESTADLVRKFPYWFSPRFGSYAGHPETLPVDQHMLLALVAPRPLYVASASEDAWADPRGEFLAAMAASAVYERLGSTGLQTTEMPPVNRPVGGAVRYHLREGKHDITLYDWAQYLDFADRWLRGRGA